MKKSLFVMPVLLYLVLCRANAQELPIRAGFKLGLPNIAGLNFEYVTPLMDGKLAGSLDITYIPIGISEPVLTNYSAESFRFAVSYVELAANYYFFKQGKGLYGSAGIGRLGANYRYSGVVSDINGELTNGTAKANFSAVLLNFKLGAKLGNTFYFRPEIGYGIVGRMPASAAVTVTFPDGTTESASESDYVEAPGFLGGSVIFNLGFGFAF